MAIQFTGTVGAVWGRECMGGSVAQAVRAIFRVASRNSYFRNSPLNELALKRPSEVMSRYSTSATKVGSTQVALGFLMGLVSLDFGLTTCSLIWLETVRPTRPNLPHLD